MDNIVVANKATSELTAKTWGDLSLDSPSVVQMPVPPSQVASVSRNGQDLVVNLKNGEHIKVANFFNTAPEGPNSDMVFQSEDGTLWQAQYDTQSFNGFTFDKVNSLDELIADAGLVDGATPTFAIAGLGLLGAGGAAAAAGGVAGGGGGGGGGGGNAADTSAPVAPGNLLVSADGTLLTGTSEAGATIQVRNNAGTLLGSGVVAPDGSFSVTLNPPQTSGQPLAVSATDAAGNVSPSTQAPTPDIDGGTPPGSDTTPPPAPGNLAVNPTGSVLTGTGEAGATIQVRAADGTLLGSGIVATDGTFSLTLSPAQTDGQSLTVTATDPAGNISVPAQALAPDIDVTPPGDTTPPDAPANLAVSANGTRLTGSGEAGATVQVRAADGTLLGSAVVGADGTFSLTLSPAQTDGQSLTVNAVDAAGNVSPPAQALAPDIDVPPGGDTTPPNAPGNLVVSADGTRITGSGEVGATIQVRAADGTLLGSGTVGADGTFSLGLNPPQTDGQSLTVNAVDASGNVSPPAQAQAPDIDVTPPGGDVTPPDAPTGIAISGNGSIVSGRGEVGSTASVIDANGNVLGTAVVGTDGLFNITLNAPQNAGQPLQVTLTDAAGNTSANVPLQAPDTTPPAAPSDFVLSADGLTLTGRAEAGARVLVRNASGAVIGATRAGLDGTFSVTLDTAQLNGEKLNISATDSAGNSASAELTAADTTPPSQVTDVVISADGTQVSGKGEVGATVTIVGASGTPIGTAIVGANGTFETTLTTPVNPGDQVQFTQTDTAGLPSPVLVVTAPDASGPATPSGLVINADGTQLSGTASAGSVVQVRDANGVLLGSATVGSNGSFTVVLNPAQANGEVLDVVAVDGQGESSVTVPVTAPDITGPSAATELSVASNGLTLTGRGEPGSTVSVRDALGNVIGTGVTSATGNFTVTLASAQTNGQALQVVLNDAAGNPSPAAPVSAPDLDGPLQPAAISIDASGTTLTGTGEAGSTITVTDANGTVLGTAIAAANGQFSVTLNTPQNNGQTLSISASDSSGGAPATVTFVTPDTQAPAALTNLVLDGNGLTLTGVGEAGASVTVRDAAGNVIGTGQAGADGSFTLTLTTAQTDGQLLQVTQADAAGNQSVAAPVTAPDLSAPAPVTNLDLSANGLIVTGNGQIGATVTVKDALGATLGSAVVGSDGRFEVTLSSAQINGQNLSVSQVDGSALASPAVPLQAADIQAPDAPTSLTLSADGLTLSGQGEPGATVNVRDANGNVLGTATADPVTGRFNVTLNSTQDDGQVLQVKQTDAAGNISPASPFTAPDTTAPDAPTGITISNNGLTVSGTGIAGDTVQVRDASGNLLGSAVVAGNGSFAVTLSPAQLDGQVLSVTQTDASTLPSLPGSVTAPDITAPPAPSGLSLDGNGVLTGTTVADGSVKILDANGVQIGTATAGTDGTFTVNLSPILSNGETVQVVATDGPNDSLPTAVFAPDTTRPVDVTNLAISPDGASVSGVGEPGTTVTVRGPGNQQLGIGTVGQDGTFVIGLDQPVASNTTVDVISTDAAGNASNPVALAGPDGTQLATPNGMAISTDGFIMTGAATAGSTVTILDSNGVSLGSGRVNSFGRFSILMRFAQLNAQTLHVVSTDDAGHTSVTALVVANDLTAPDAPAGLTINADGSVVSGRGEAGSTVAIANSGGTVLGSGTVAPNGTFAITVTPSQLDGQPLTATQTDLAGNVSQSGSVIAPDLTAPNAATGLTINNVGTVVNGLGEAGATVTIRDAAGNILATGLVNQSGQFQVTLPNAVTTGAPLNVTLTDAAGNVSAGASLTTVDTTPPALPQNLLISANGSTLTGTGEAGATVKVLDANGTLLGTALVASDGTFTVTLAPAPNNGQALDISQTDPSGNVSPSANLTAPDITPPAALTQVAVNADGLTVTGRGEPGATVSVRTAGGALLGTALVAANGAFSVTLSTAQINAEVLTVTQEDPPGNVSTAVNVTSVDLTAPDSPTALLLSGSGVQLAGNAEAGSTVTVRDASGNVLGSGVAGANGVFQVSLSSPQLNGQSLSVTSTDAAGNVSVAAPYQAADTTAPAAASNLAVSANGLTLGGTGEAGATVVVRDANGNALGTATVAANGSFTVGLNPAAVAGSTLTVVQTDAAGNPSDASTVIAPGNLAEPAPLNLALSADGLTLTGTANAGSTVSIRTASGVLLGTALVNGDGTFSAQLNAAQLNGESLSAIATSSDGINSLATGYLAADVTAPGQLTDLVLNTNGVTLTGHGEVGATVTVLGTGGVILGTGQVGADGNFSLTLSAPQIAGQSLSISQTDVAGNESASVDLTARDLIAPNAPLALAVTPDGAVLSGTGEPGATVNVFNAAGALVGSGSVRIDGTFQLTLTTPQANGELLAVTLTDAAGNISLPASLTSVDTTAPLALTQLNISSDGATLTGRGEAGAIVTVTNTLGTVLGTVTVGVTGAFTLVLAPALTNAEVLTLVQRDAVGNVSPQASLTTPDFTPPDQLDNVRINAAGAVITGTGEAGATVTVRDAGGTLLGTTLVLTDGTFSVTLSTPQINNQVLSVQQADPPGNVSVPATVIAPDLTPPAVATDLQFNASGSVLSGSGEAGAGVRITLADGTQVGTGTVGVDGKFLITLTQTQNAGQPVFVVLTDAANNASAAGSLASPDLTPPAAVTNVQINDTGVVVSGRGEAGASLLITDAAGNIVGTGVVGVDGNFAVSLSVPQTNGELLSIVQRDAAGNPSAGAPVTAPDITPPALPVLAPLSANGLTLTGTGEVGATVKVTSATGASLGTTTVLGDGTFSVTLSSAQLNGQTLNVTQTDAANNVSGTVVYQAADVTDPLAVTNLSVSQDGLTLSGRGEPGATVSVALTGAAQGTPALGTAIVRADGTFSVPLTTAQLNGQSLSVVQVDAAQNDSISVAVTAPDSTPPAVPVFTSLTGNGTILQGTAEANSTVTVTSANGTLLGSAQVGANGQYSVTLSPAQTNGQVISIVATDAANNHSAPLVQQVPDTQAHDPVSNLTISADYLLLAGRGEAGATVTVKNSLGATLGTGQVAANGTFVVTLVPGVTANNVLTVGQVDASNNVSGTLDLTVPVTPPPNAPTSLLVSADGLSVTGNAATGTTITVYSATGVVLGTAATNAGGTFNVTLNSAQTNGQSLGVTASTGAGGASLPAAVLAADTTPPAVLSDLAVSATGTLVSGRGEAGATVTITTAAGVTLGTALVNAGGTFGVVLNTAQANGQILNAYQTDTAGLPSAILTVTAPDTTAPNAPASLVLNGAGTVLSGIGEAGATVTVRSSLGVVLGTATVAVDGTFNANLSAAQLNGQLLSVSQRDVAGNVSLLANLSAVDTTPPAALTNVALNVAGLQVSGNGEAGATVRVTNAAGVVLGSAVVSAAGGFVVLLSSAQLNGQVLSVQQADVAGNASVVATVNAPDLQAPNPPSALVLAANGLTLSGNGEVGATVRVFNASGTLLGTTTVGAGGTFNLTLNAAQLDGQALTVRQVDVAGNVSAAGSLVAADITPPGAPTAVAVNASGSVVTGTGVAGSTVTVRNAIGAVLGSTTVAANGSFSVALSAAQINNQVLSISQADAAGNVSISASAIAPDLTPPAAPGALLVSVDGLTVSGTGEIGSTVQIKSTGGAVLGTGTVGATGLFSVTLAPAQINGETLLVSLTDIKGNLSVAANVTAPDIDVNTPVIASDNLATASVSLVPVKTTQNVADSFSTLLAGFSKAFVFTVNSGTTLDPTLTLTTGSAVSLLDGVVYTLQVKNASGSWVTLDVNGNGGLLDLVALTGQGVRVNIADLQGGDYRLVVSSTGIGVVTTVTTQLQLDVTSLTQFNGVAGAAVTGNVITNVGTDGQVDVTGPDNGAVLQVLKNGSYVTASAGTTVQGLYGTLTIDASGNYSYTPNGAVASVGKVDVFSYQLVHPNGLSDTANLYVRIDSPQATEVWSDTNLASPALLVDATNDIAVSDITLVNKEVITNSTLGSFSVPVLGGGNGSWNTSVAAGTISDLTVVVSSSNVASLLGSLTVGLYKLNTATGQYVLVKSYGGSALANLGGNSYGIRFDDQTAGSYQVKISSGGIGVLTTVNASLINDATYTNQFVVSSYTPVAGNLLTDTAGGGADVLGSAYTVLSVLAAGNYVTPGYNGTTILGTYGSLLVQADGRYTYTLTPGQTNAVIGHEDIFTYQLKHPNGTTDTATLTVDLEQAGAAVTTSFAALSTVANVDDHSATAVATTGAELIQGTAGNDTLDGSHGGAVTLQGGAGNDTLIIADQHFASVDGGTGTDTLLWAGGDATINLGDLQSRIHNIEVLDLNHTSAVALTISLADLVSITSADNNTLIIKGGSEDSVHMTNTWVAGGAQQADGVDYTQYTPQEDPTHHLWVQNGIHVV
ncbi:Ig-like domain-containing protein [Pseudomonas sp. KU26590]|uniref:BapA/Bap/LapF family large adhesin n=1 Tax=Pseudomonas sp. KU26590 TaxID=2991051 RepID=UPI00223DC758|nr:BapA/Bap/LapF family large adhesin [Pseudomonas sp. KU26590]UZJ57669.1 Ig-like domain-containing protein [Pseudomonas sp. KU26590]